MESTSINEVRKAIQVYDDALRADDPRFRREVTLIHEDGTYQHITSAFLIRYGEYIVCFTEHQGTLINHASDLIAYGEAERRRDAIEELP